MEKLKIKLMLLLSVIFLLISSVYASDYPIRIPDANTLNADTFTLDYIYASGVVNDTTAIHTDLGILSQYPGKPDSTYDYGAVGNNLLIGDYYNATGLAGFFTGNDPLPDSPNIGENLNGILNGEETIATGDFSGEEFLTTEWDVLSDVDHDGEDDDPGWIYLGKVEASGSADYEPGIGPFPPYIPINIDIAELLALNFIFDTTGEGFWELATDPTKMEAVLELLEGASFDHLTFILKAKTKFAIYDFNFNHIIREVEVLLGNEDLNFETAYVLGGKISARPDFNDISHISIHARDPQNPSSVVPEPATMILFGLGLLGLAGVGRRKK